MRGRRASSKAQKATVKGGGALGSEDADMSSDKQGENPGRRKPKVSWATFVGPGLVGT